mgnify:CR=1 FL=1
MVVRIGTLRDIQTHDPQRRQPVLQFLRWLTWVELVLLGFAGVAVWFVPDTSPARFGALVPSLLVFFMVDLLLRMVVSFALVTARLQQESDRARQLVLTRETESRALVDNLSAGVMVFRPDQTLASVNSAARRWLGWDEGRGSNLLVEPVPGGAKAQRLQQWLGSRAVDVEEKLLQQSLPRQQQNFLRPALMLEQ